MSKKRIELRLNPIMCVAHGMCAELFPERITLDDWGYPIIDPTPITPALEEHARRAVDMCPTLALLLERSAVEVSRSPETPAASRPRR